MRSKSFFFVLFLSLILVSPGYAAQGQFYDKTLVLSIATEPKTFNVLVAQETSSTEVTQYLFEGLTEFDPRTGTNVPGLAESWDHSPDGLIWTFHLRKGARWSDGKPFTSQDVIFTFEKVIFNPAIPNSARDIFTIQGKPVILKALDDQTVELHLAAPFAPLLFALSQPIIPKHILETFVYDGTFSSAWGLGEKPERVVGTGPFKIAKVLPGEKVELVRNPFYWKKSPDGKSLPRLDRIILLIVPSQENQLLRFLDGETDLFTLRGADYPVLKPLEKKKNFRIYQTGPSLGSFFVAFNQQTKTPWKQKWFQNRDFRRALSHAIDRASMADIVFNRFASKQCSPLSPSVPFFYNEEAPCYDYEPKTAKTILTDIVGFQDKNKTNSPSENSTVNWASPGNLQSEKNKGQGKDGILEDEEGHPLEIVLVTNTEDPTRLQIAQMIREDWRKIGIKVHLLPMEFNALVSKLTVTHDWEVVVMGLTGSVDPHFGANVWLSTGNLHFWNPGGGNASYIETKVDELFGKAAVTLDRDKRKEFYDEWQRIEAEELPLISTVLPEVLYAVRDRFVSVKPTAIGGPFYPLEELETKKS